MNCDDLYNAVISGGGGGNYILFDLAECFISGYNKEKLRAMLRSDDIGVVSDGLFISGEIGKLAGAYSKEFEALTMSDDENIRKSAKALLAIYSPR